MRSKVASGAMRLGEILGHVVATAVLTTVYLVVLAHLGHVMRWTGTDPIARQAPVASVRQWKRRGVRRKDHYDHLS